MKKNNFLEGALIATIAIFFSKFLGIIYVIPFYSIVGTQGGALYGYAYNIYNLFLIISTAGIPLAISKLTSEYNALNKIKEKEYLFKSTKTIILIFSIFCFLLCFIFAPNIAKLIIGDIKGGNTIKDISIVIRCVSFAILFVPSLSVIRGYLQGHRFIKPSSFSQVIEQIVRILVIIIGSYLTLKVFNLGLTNAVGVAVFGATAGAITAYLYLINKAKKIKNTGNTNDLNKNEKKEIIKKIIYYSIPFIIINIANALYNTTDMILLNKGLELLNYEGKIIENVSSVFTTWGHKLNAIITSIATGVAISLIPSISENRAKNDNLAINDKLNKILLIFLYIALPLAIFMSIFSKQIWTIFYGSNFYGPIIFKFLVITAAFDALYIMLNNAMQGLNKTKLIYISVISGLIANLCLDLPFMFLFQRLGIYPFYGAILATIIGYTISLIIPLVTLKNEFKISYTKTLNKIPKLIGIFLILIFISIIYRGIINNVYNRLLLILLISIIGIVTLIIYYFLSKYELKEIFGKDIKDILRKKRD